MSRWLDAFSKTVCMKKKLNLILDLGEVKSKLVCPCNQNCTETGELQATLGDFQCIVLWKQRLLLSTIANSLKGTTERGMRFKIVMLANTRVFWSRMSVLHSHKFPLATRSCLPGVLCYQCFAHSSHSRKNKCILSLPKGCLAVGIKVSLDHSESF